MPARSRAVGSLGSQGIPRSAQLLPCLHGGWVEYLPRSGEPEDFGSDCLAIRHCLLLGDMALGTKARIILAEVVAPRLGRRRSAGRSRRGVHAEPNALDPGGSVFGSCRGATSRLAAACRSRSEPRRLGAGPIGTTRASILGRDRVDRTCLRCWRDRTRRSDRSRRGMDQAWRALVLPQAWIDHLRAVSEQAGFDLSPNADFRREPTRSRRSDLG